MKMTTTAAVNILARAGLEKEAGVGSALRGAGQAVKAFASKSLGSPYVQGAVGMAVAAPLVTAAGVGAIGGVRSLHRAFTRGKDFRRMLDVRPSLADADPNKVRLAFNTLHHLNPSMARVPLVASTFVEQALDSDLGTGMRVGLDTAKTLMGQQITPLTSPAAAAQQALTKGMSQMFRGVGRGQQSAGGGRSGWREEEIESPQAEQSMSAEMAES